MNKRDTLETWFRRVWHEEDTAAIDELLRPDASVQGLGAFMNAGPAQFRPFVAAVLGLIGEVDVTIERTMEDGDWIHALITVRGRARRDATAVEFPGQVLVRVVDGKLVEAYNSIDFLGLFEQLGLLPADTFACCLGGHRIG